MTLQTQLRAPPDALAAPLVLRVPVEDATRERHGLELEVALLTADRELYERFDDAYLTITV